MFEYAVYNKKDICVFQSSYKVPCRTKSTRIRIGEYSVETEHENEIASFYFLKKMLGPILQNKKLSDLEKNYTLTNLCLYERKELGKLDKGLEKLKPGYILRDKGVYIDIIEEIHVVYDLNNLISGSIIGRVFIKGAPYNKTIVGFVENKDIEVVQGDASVGEGRVLVGGKQILTYSIAKDRFNVPISLKYDKASSFLTVENTSEWPIKDIKIQVPIDTHTYAKSTFTDGAKSSLCEHEGRIDWTIECLETSSGQSQSRLQIKERCLPTKSLDSKILKVAFSVPFYKDAGISIKHCDVEGVRQKDVFVSTMCQTRVFDVRIDMK